jgi:SAM-dependent methyltransferase
MQIPTALTDLDSPEAIAQHASLIRTKPFLRRVYEEHYSFFRAQIGGVPPGTLIELGSGGGFLREFVPTIICTDLVPANGGQLVCSGLALPFADSSLAALCMLNVFHHLQDARGLLTEASRCLKPGGKLLMVEPANTIFSRFVYRNFHHEPFEPSQSEWQLERGGRMTSANGALPWIVFIRDRQLFERAFPELAIDTIELCHPLRYLVSGGLSLPALLPISLYPMVSFAEKLLTPLMPQLALFMRIVIRRVG